MEIRGTDIIFLSLVGLILIICLYLNDVKDFQKQYIQQRVGNNAVIEDAGENTLFSTFKYNVYANKNGILGKKQTFFFDGKKILGKK